MKDEFQKDKFSKDKFPNDKFPEDKFPKDDNFSKKLLTGCASIVQCWHPVSRQIAGRDISRTESRNSNFEFNFCPKFCS